MLVYRNCSNGRNTKKHMMETFALKNKSRYASKFSLGLVRMRRSFLDRVVQCILYTIYGVDGVLLRVICAAL